MYSVLYIFAFVFDNSFSVVMKNETNKAVRKSNQKYNSYNPTVMDHLADKWGITKTYIRQCLNGTRNSTTADRIKKEYRETLKRVEKALNQ